jgi:DNA-binding Lrp family transcriptional regulator
MYKKYDLSDIQKRVIDLLQNNNPMSSSEISNTLGTNRITVSKYLDILYFQKILNRKRIGSVNFWFLDPGIINLDLKDENFLEIQQKIIESLINGQKEFTDNIVLSLINRNINMRKIFTDVCFPVLNTILELYNRGKIGKTEKIHLLTNLTDSFRLLRNNIKINSNNNRRFDNSLLVIVSGDDESLPICIMIDVLTRRDGLNSTIIGNVENVIDPFFDIDFQRYINKLSKRVKGKTTIIVVSHNETAIRFLHSSLINQDGKEKYEIIVFSNKAMKEKLEKSVSSPIYSEIEPFLSKLEIKNTN